MHSHWRECPLCKNATYSTCRWRVECTRAPTNSAALNTELAALSELSEVCTKLVGDNRQAASSKRVHHCHSGMLVSDLVSVAYIYIRVQHDLLIFQVRKMRANRTRHLTPTPMLLWQVISSHWTRQAYSSSHKPRRLTRVYFFTYQLHKSPIR